jgi:hypothetical protein
MIYLSLWFDLIFVVSHVRLVLGTLDTDGWFGRRRRIPTALHLVLLCATFWSLSTATATPPCILCPTMLSPSTPAGRQHNTTTPASSPIRLLVVLLPWWHRWWCCCCFGGVLVVKWCCCACNTAGAIYLNHNASGTVMRLQPRRCLLWANLLPVPLLQWLWIGGYMLVCDTHSCC